MVKMIELSFAVGDVPREKWLVFAHAWGFSALNPIYMTTSLLWGFDREMRGSRYGSSPLPKENLLGFFGHSGGGFKRFSLGVGALDGWA
jgi:hypothetical protein